MIVIGIEDDLDVIGADIRVAAGKTRPYTARARVVVHPRAHVDRGRVKDEAHLGALRRDLALVRLSLSQAGGGRRGMPDRLVELAVQVNLFVQRHGPHFRGRRGMDVLRY